MEQVPRAGGTPVGECSGEQATREHNGDPVVGGEVLVPVPVCSARAPGGSGLHEPVPGEAHEPRPGGYAAPCRILRRGRPPDRREGPLGRSWVAPPGTAVLCSILLRPDLGPGQLHLAAWVVALAAVQACRGVSGVKLALKWPNDLTAGSGGEAPEWRGGRPGAGRKVAGILSEIVAPRTTEQGGRLADRSRKGSSWASGST